MTLGRGAARPFSTGIAALKTKLTGNLFEDGETQRVNNIGLIAEDFHTIFGNGPETQISTREVEMALWLGEQQLYKNDQKKDQRI